jgi:hypothetical protein
MKEDFEPLRALAGLELKRRRLTEELREVLIEYQQLQLEIDRRSIVIPWLIELEIDRRSIVIPWLIGRR